MGSGRTATSFRISANTPPVPTSTAGPNTGSRVTPTIISVPPSTCCWICTPSMRGRALGPRGARDELGVDRPWPRLAEPTDRRTSPASDLWGKSGEAIFITTGKPMSAAMRAASAAEWATPSPARGTPKDSSNCRDASAPRGADRSAPTSVECRRPPPWGGGSAWACGTGTTTRPRWYSAKVRSAAKQLRNDRNSGTPASTSVLKPCSSVLNEFHVTTMGFDTLVDEGHDVLGEPVREPAQRSGEADHDDVDVRGRRR